MKKITSLLSIVFVLSIFVFAVGYVINPYKTQVPIAYNDTTGTYYLNYDPCSFSMAGNTLVSPVKTATIDINNVNLKALDLTPQTLIAAPGTGKVIEVIGCWLMHDYKTAAFAADTDTVCVHYTDGSGKAATGTVTITDLLATAEDNIAHLAPVAVTDTAAHLQNAAVVLAAVDGPETGGGSLKVKIMYRIISTGL